MNKEKLTLFAIGMFLNEAGRRFSQSPLKFSLTKAELIDDIISLGAVYKKERAIYRDLESLEKKGLIMYKGKDVKLTKKGVREFNNISQEHKIMTSAKEKILNRPIKFKRKIQAKLV
jgi:DNA-binding PadR family transcriptional regulator